MFWFLLLSSITVSIDSLVCGFSLCIGNSKKLRVVLFITVTVFLMCLTTNYLTVLFSHILTEKTTAIGGLILIFVGLFNLLKKDDQSSIKHATFKDLFLSGFAVGLDGAFLNLSLAIMGINFLYVPLLIAVVHGLAIGIGLIISTTSFVRKIEKFSFVAPLILIGLGVYKIIAVLL